MWSYEADSWRHLDDVMAITFILWATSLVARRRCWWLAGILIGLAVASKPWALIMAPVLLGLPREDRAKATIAALGTAGGVLGAVRPRRPRHPDALGGFRLIVSPSSTLRLVGVTSVMAPAWVRPLQMVGGFALMTVLARRSHWVGIAFAGFAFRVVDRPPDLAVLRAWPADGRGAVGLAPRAPRPGLDAATLGVEYGIPTSPRVHPRGRSALVWAVAVFVSCARFGRRCALRLHGSTTRHRRSCRGAAAGA